MMFGTGEKKRNIITVSINSCRTKKQIRDLKNQNLATCVTATLQSGTCLSLAAFQYTLFVRINLNT